MNIEFQSKERPTVSKSMEEQKGNVGGGGQMTQANKKRKYGEITNLGAGLDDSQKHSDMREIER